MQGHWSRPLIAVAGWGVAAALAQQPAPPAPAFAPSNLAPKAVQAMAGNCAICHGTQGRPAPGSSVARLAARPAALIVAAMRDFRDGKREATVMHQIAKGFTEAEVAAMAAYFSSLPEDAP